MDSGDAKRFLGGGASSARRLWESEDLSVAALAFADDYDLRALRAVSRHARDVASADALWGPHVLSLDCAHGLHAAGHISLTFATFWRLQRKCVNKFVCQVPADDPRRQGRRYVIQGPPWRPVPFTVGRIEHDKYALAFEIRRRSGRDPVVLSTVLEFVTSAAFPAGELREWAVRMEEQCGRPDSVAVTWDFLHLDDATRRLIESLELGRDIDVPNLRCHARLIRKSDGKLVDLEAENPYDIEDLEHEWEHQESYRDLIKVSQHTGWDFGRLTLDYRYIEDEDDEDYNNLPLLGLSLVRYTRPDNLFLPDATHYDVFPDRAPEGEDLFY